MIEENTDNAFKEFSSEVNRLSENRYKKEVEKMVIELGENKAKQILKQYNLDKGE